MAWTRTARRYALVATLVFLAPAQGAEFTVPTGGPSDQMPDLGFPSEVQLDFGFLTDVASWFNPDTLEQLNTLVRTAEVFRRIVELPPDASIFDFLSTFTGFDASYDEALRSVQRLLDTGGAVQQYLNLLDPDGLLKGLPVPEPEAITPLRLHSAPLAASDAASAPPRRFNGARYQASQRLSQVDTHPKQVASLLPYVEFTSNSPGAEEPVVTSTPNLPLEQSTESAWELRRAWQVFEERYFQRVNAEINQPIPYLMYCQAGLTSAAPSTPKVTPGLSVRRTDVAPDFFRLTRNRLEYGRYDDRLHLEGVDYFASRLFPRVPGDYFCDDLPFRAPHWLPSVKLSVCGVTIYEPDDFPRPSYVNASNVKDGVEDAILRAHDTYLPQYLNSTLSSLVPNARHPLLFPTPWQYPVLDQGTVIYPVSDNEATDLTPIKELGDQAKRLFDGTLTGELAHLYYLAPLLQMSEDPALQTAGKLRALIALLEPEALAQGANGAYPLEELKRWLPPSNMVFHELFGYQTFYRVYYETRTTFLPDFMINNGEKFLYQNAAARAFAMALRQPYLFYTGFQVDWCGGVTVTPVLGSAPIYEFVPELSYLALGYPFVGVQARYDWFTNPEGYPIPSVKDTPLLDYWGLPYMNDALARGGER